MLNIDFRNLAGMEILWLTVFAGSLIFAMYATYRDGISRSYTLFIISAIALIMFVVRYNLRKYRKD